MRNLEEKCLSDVPEVHFTQGLDDFCERILKSSRESGFRGVTKRKILEDFSVLEGSEAVFLEEFVVLGVQDCD